MLPCVCSVINHRWRENVVRTWQHGIYLFYIITKQTTTDKVFLFKIFQHNAKAGLCSLWRTRKKPFHAIYYLYKMKQSYWLPWVAKNCDWSRKITPLSNLTRASFLMKTYSESRMELRNLQILKKMMEKSSRLLSSEQPCQPKSLHVALNIEGVEKILTKNLWSRSTSRPFDSSFEWKER